MELWQAIVIGIVEGITEYLPVSSTGHLIITTSLMGLHEPPDVKRAVDAYNIVIQGGAILAVLTLYWPRVQQMILGLLGKDAGGVRLFRNIVIAFLPAAVIGVLLKDMIDRYLFSLYPVVAALMIGGVYMILVDRFAMRRLREREAEEDKDPELRDDWNITKMTVRQSLIIGFMQCIAMWPGTSRSMMTITAGVLVGLKPRQAAEFSFLLGLPTLGGATVYALVKNLHESARDNEPNMFEQLGWMPLLVGTFVTTITAIIAVKWLIGFLNKHGLAPFGYYRIIVGAVLLTLGLMGVVHVVD